MKARVNLTIDETLLTKVKRYASKRQSSLSVTKPLSLKMDGQKTLGTKLIHEQQLDFPPLERKCIYSLWTDGRQIIPQDLPPDSSAKY